MPLPYLIEKIIGKNNIISYSFEDARQVIDKNKYYLIIKYTGGVNANVIADIPETIAIDQVLYNLKEGAIFLSSLLMQEVNVKAESKRRIKVGNSLVVLLNMAIMVKDKKIHLYFPMVFFDYIARTINAGRIKTLNDFTTIIEEFDSIVNNSLNLPVSLDKVFSKMTDSQLQHFLTTMLSRKGLSIDMLIGVMMGLEDKGKRILENLSKNIRQDVYDRYNSNSGISNRWIMEATYQLKSNLIDILGESNIQIDGIELLKKMKHDYELKLIRDFFSFKRFEDYIVEADDIKILSRVITKTESLTLATSLIDTKPEILDIIRSYISKRGFKLILEDINYKKKNTKKEEILFARMDVVKNIIDVRFDMLDSGNFDCEDILEHINIKRYVNIIYKYIGLADFVYAIKTFKGNIRKELYQSLDVPVNYLVEDIIMGMVRLDGIESEQRVREAIYKFSKGLYTLIRIGQIKYEG